MVYYRKPKFSISVLKYNASKLFVKRIKEERLEKDLSGFLIFSSDNFERIIYILIMTPIKKELRLTESL